MAYIFNILFRNKNVKLKNYGSTSQILEESGLQNGLFLSFRKFNRASPLEDYLQK
jgi:hypothetical protein